MKPQDLAAIHAAAFAPSGGWSAEAIQSTCESPGVTCYAQVDAFALVRSVAGEAELLTLAVHPRAQGKGLGSALMQQWLMNETAERLFLDVAEDNVAARALYRKHGFSETGRRKDYYQRADGTKTDALLMQLAKPAGQRAQTPPKASKTG